MKPGGSHPLPNLPADEDELEADVDLVLPRRRRRASDDEDGSEGGFHDAVESVGEAESAGAEWRRPLSPVQVQSLRLATGPFRGGKKQKL